MVRGLFEGAQYNSEAGAKCAVYSRARTKQGRGVIEEIWYTDFLQNSTDSTAIFTSLMKFLLMWQVFVELH